jgi:hypothetical protein
MIPHLSALIYGPSGGGKSWAGSTTPPPRLIIDLEGRAGYTPNGEQATSWDGVSDPMQLAPSPSRTYIVTLTDMALLDGAIYNRLRSGAHPFKSVTVDSLMFAQMRTKNAIRPGTDHLREQDWGTLDRSMQKIVQDFHDLTLLPATKVRCVVFIAGTFVKDGFQVPLMQGGIAGKLPYMLDLAGYLENARAGDGSLVRQLIIEPYPAQGIRDVKDGTHRIKSTLGGVIADPNFELMFNALGKEDE